MKSFEEMAQNVLRRRDEILAKRRRRKIMLVRYAASVSALTAVALVGISAWKLADHEREFYNFDESSSSESDELDETSQNASATTPYDNIPNGQQNDPEQPQNTQVVIVAPDGTVETVIASPDGADSGLIVTVVNTTDKYGRTSRYDPSKIRPTAVTTDKRIFPILPVPVVTKNTDTDGSAATSHTSVVTDTSEVTKATNKTTKDDSEITLPSQPIITERYTTKPASTSNDATERPRDSASTTIHMVTEIVPVTLTQMETILSPAASVSAVTAHYPTDSSVNSDIGQIYRSVIYNGETYYYSSECSGGTYSGMVGIYMSGTDPNTGNFCSTVGFVSETNYADTIIVSVDGAYYYYVK